MGFFKKKAKEEQPVVPTKTVDCEPNPVGWDAIVTRFEELYPGQQNPKHYGVLISWELGGNDPLRGISIYEAPEYYHFVSFGLSELYEKESKDPNYSGYGFELTCKLSKAGLGDDHEGQLRCICGILQAVARMTFTNGDIFRPYEYLYTGQTQGIDVGKNSCLTGFITCLDEAGSIETPNGNVTFVQLIGASDAELQAIINKQKTVKDLLDALGHTLTDYTRTSLV